MVQPWALASFKCAHHVQLWDKTRASAPVCIREDYEADKMQSGGDGAGVKEQDQEEGKKGNYAGDGKSLADESQGSRATRTNWSLHKQAVDCVLKHQWREPQPTRWDPPRSAPLYSFPRRWLIRQEGLPFSDRSPPTAVHPNAHLNSNGGELHQLQVLPFFSPRTYTLKIYSAADKWDTAAHGVVSAKPRRIFLLTSFSRSRAGEVLSALSLSLTLTGNSL